MLRNCRKGVGFGRFSFGAGLGDGEFERVGPGVLDVIPLVGPRRKRLAEDRVEDVEKGKAFRPPAPLRVSGTGGGDWKEKRGSGHGFVGDRLSRTC